MLQYATSRRSKLVRIQREALRQIRERTGMSVPALARDAKCSHGALYDIEAGKRGASDEMIVKLARALKVPVTSIICDPDGADVTAAA